MNKFQHVFMGLWLICNFISFEKNSAFFGTIKRALTTYSFTIMTYMMFNDSMTSRCIQSVFLHLGPWPFGGVCTIPGTLVTTPSASRFARIANWLWRLLGWLVVRVGTLLCEVKFQSHDPEYTRGIPRIVNHQAPTSQWLNVYPTKDKTHRHIYPIYVYVYIHMCVCVCVYVTQYVMYLFLWFCKSVPVIWMHQHQI